MLPKFVRSSRDLGAGLVYLTLGGGAALVARGYPLGSAQGFGPGYLPLVLGLVLVAMGVVSLLRCIMLNTEAIGSVAWRGLFLVTSATLVCALLLPVAGALAALAALLLIGAAASRHFRLEPKMLLGAAVLVGVCVLVFVVALGVPLPLIGG
jgi:putative tricarboxylic transport membrane protein